MYRKACNPNTISVSSSLFPVGNRRLYPRSRSTETIQHVKSDSLPRSAAHCAVLKLGAAERTCAGVAGLEPFVEAVVVEQVITSGAFPVGESFLG